MGESEKVRVSAMMGYEGGAPVTVALSEPGRPPVEGAALIVACGASKRATAAPAWDFYTGAGWSMVRRWLLEGGPVPGWLYVLSAEHGLIPAATVIDPYDRRMTRDRARELAPQVAAALAGYPAVEVWGGAVYLEALAELAIPAARIGSGGIGYQRAALGERLRRFWRPRLAVELYGDVVCLACGAPCAPVPSDALPGPPVCEDPIACGERRRRETMSFFDRFMPGAKP